MMKPTQKYTIPIIIMLSLGLLILVMLTVIKKQSPPPSPPPSLPSRLGNLQTTSVVRYDGPLFSPPEKLNTHTTTTPSIKVLAEDYATKLELTQVQDTTTLWQAQDKTVSLFINENPAFIQIQYDVAAPTTPGIDISTANEKVESWLKTNNVTLTSQPNKALFLSDAVEYSLTKPEFIIDREAFFVRIPLIYMYDDMAVYIDDSPVTVANALVTSDYNLSQITVFPQPTEMRNTKSYPSITIDGAVSNIQQGEGRVVSLGRLDSDISNLKNTILTNAWIEYRLNSKDMIMYPYYHFSGTADGSDIEIITLAIIL